MAPAWLAGALSAQGSGLEHGDGEGFLGYRHAGAWSEPLGLESSGLARGVPRAQLGSASLGGPRFEMDSDDGELAARLRVEPPPATRASLEGAGEALAGYHALPGGIVLGLEARVGRALAQAASGARLEGTPTSPPARGLALRLRDGRRLALPALAPEVLRSLLEFQADGREALVDLLGPEAAPRLAPSLANGPLAPELARLDRLPHQRWPETRACKTLIVDRAVRLDLRGEALVLAADLEVRLYRREAASGAAARREAREAVAPDFIGPRTATDLGPELAPLAELAAWLGLLRWLEGVDPEGLARLRAGVGALDSLRPGA